MRARRNVRAVALIGATTLLLSGCNLLNERHLIDEPTPTGKIIDDAPTVNAHGTIPGDVPLGGTLKVNGIVVPYGPMPDRAWNVDVPRDPNYPVTEIKADYTDKKNNFHRDITAVVTAPSLPDTPAGMSPDGVGMRFTSQGLTGLGPVINNLAASSFNVSGLLVGQAVNSSDATGTVTDAQLGNLSLTPTATATGVKAVVTMTDLSLGVNLNVTTLSVGYCRLEVDVPTVTITGYYDMKPGSPDPNVVDVNLINGGAGTPAYSVKIEGATPGSGLTVNHQFTDGNCDPDVFLLGPIISSIAGSSIPDTINSSFQSQLKDPDGAGPLDNPVADAVETALSGISIAGPVGTAVGAHLDAPLQDVTEDAGGITFRSNANFSTVDPGTGDPTCTPTSPFAPDLQSTVDMPSTFPAPFAATTPVGGQNYGLGLAISSSSFNQMIGSMTECGLLNSEINVMNGVPITSTSLVTAGLAKFAKVGDNVPMHIRIRPTVGPFLTGNTGPNGERAELFLANLMIDFVQDAAGGNPEVVWLTTAIDTPMGFDLTFDSVAKALKPTITAAPPARTRARVVSNKVGVNESGWEWFFPGVFAFMSQGLTETFAAFPLPEFLGLSLDVLEVGSQDNTWVLYANLNPAPAVSITGVGSSYTGAGAYETDSPTFNSYQFRTRVRKGFGTTNANFQWQGGIYDDACCANIVGGSDSDDTRTATYSGSFTVNPATDDPNWQLDIAQSIKGALTTVDDGSGNGWSSISAVSGSVNVGGTVTPFNMAGGAASLSSNSNSQNVGFAANNSMRITGSGTKTVTLTFSFTMRAASDSTFGGAGIEAAVRMGLGDTLANGYTAGAYPYQNPYTTQRNPGLDGHFSSVKACKVQAGGAACP